jgi:uncharacterized protein
VKKAQAEFEGVEFQAATNYTVVTVKDIPQDKQAEFADARKKGTDGIQSFFGKWARDMAQSRGEKGVFTLAYVAPERFFVVTVADEVVDVNRGFGNGKAKSLDNKIKLAFEEALKKPAEEAKALRDRGLLSGADYLAAQLKNTTVPDGKKTGEVRNNAAGGGGGRSSLSWVLIIGGGLLVMWLVIGLIRALTGGGGGGGGGGHGGGGGGGGFGSSLMGGMFGAMAGMYLYNSMFGGGMSSAAASDGDYGGGDTGGGGADDGNFDNGAEGGAGGGDWGDSGGDGAGGDWGGGDGGGGGDFGGGGDW